ncbi:MAG: radical SAM protein [bacterium]
MKVCNYFATLRTNDECEFDSLWPKLDEYSKIEEKPYDLMILKRAGIKCLNITGGEPLLREDLPEILRQAKNLGLQTKLTTNGILYEKIEGLRDGEIESLFISLDYPTAEQHDRSRGIECFSDAIKAIKFAKEVKQNPIINFTVTRDSVLYLPEMIDLAEKLGVRIYLNPVSDFFGTQGFESATVDHLRYYARNKRVLANLAILEFVRAGGNRTIVPRCKAKETTVSILPDGQRVKPCFFNQGGVQGRADVCSGCLRWDYMLPSFSLGLDKYFWLNLLSKLRRKI